MKTILLVTILLFFLFTGCGDIKDVSYSKDVQPILNDYCLDCHNSDIKLGNLNFENYEALMSSRYLNRTQPLVIAGEPMQSRLYLVTHSSNPAIRMPPENQGYGKLSGSEITTIKVWIAEGGKNN